jgi:hypothetical protein
VILVLLAKTVPQFTISQDKCSTSGAQHRFFVVQYPRITESETSASWTTELGSRVKPSFDVVSWSFAIWSIGMVFPAASLNIRKASAPFKFVVL